MSKSLMQEALVWMFGLKIISSASSSNPESEGADDNSSCFTTKESFSQVNLHGSVWKHPIQNPESHQFCLESIRSRTLNHTSSEP